MAKRRMFSLDICDTDLFLDLPLSSQALYFHLGLRADDDGFIGGVNKLIRLINCSQDDFKLLLAKNLVIDMGDGVIVITHWKMSNYIQKDRYKPTIYTEKKALLSQSDSHVYTLDTECIHNGYRVDTEWIPRLGKVRLGKVRRGEERKDVLQQDCDNVTPMSHQCHTEREKEKDIELDIEREKEILTLYNSILDFEEVKELSKDLKDSLSSHSIQDIEKAFKKVKESDFLSGRDGKKFKCSLDWIVDLNNFNKILNGKYDTYRKGSSNKFNNTNQSSLDYDKIERLAQEKLNRMEG